MPNPPSLLQTATTMLGVALIAAGSGLDWHWVAGLTALAGIGAGLLLRAVIPPLDAFSPIENDSPDSPPCPH
jgi:hypothetical protein